MTWKDRIGSEISLTSPDGNEFIASWQGDDILMTKKIAVYEYPKVKGTGVQDLEYAGVRYPLTIMFEGVDNDLQTQRFLDACKQKGRWAVIHPVLGRLTLQLVTFRAKLDPVESGNITKIVTEWIEPIDIDKIGSLTTPQIASQIKTQSNQTNAVASAQFKAGVVQDKASEARAVESATNSIVIFVQNNLSPLYESVSELNSQIVLIVADIQNTITQVTIDTAALAGQIQNLIQLPGLATTDIAQRLTLYSSLIVDIFGLAPTDTRPEDKNIVLCQELAASAVIVSLAQSASSGLLKTRNQAIDSSETVSGLFVDITDGLDLIQEAFINHDIDLQYFSQSSSFADAWLIINQAISYLLVASFDLLIEKIVELQRPQAPITITIEQYGSMGANDSNYDLFLESNALEGNERILLNAGRQVVVYV